MERRENSEIGYKLSAMIKTTKAKIINVKENDTFIPTKSFQDAHKKLMKNRFVVIKGNTGEGKTSIALELLHLMCQDREDGRQRLPLELYDIKDLDLVLPTSGFVIFLDNIFGRNVVKKQYVEEWKKRENSMFLKLCDSEHTEGNLLIIAICSGISSPFNGPFPETVLGNQSIVELSINASEKLEFLKSYAPKDNFVSWTDNEEKEIVRCAPDIGFPQCCSLFRDAPTLHRERVNFFRSPFHFMKCSLSKLEDGKCYGLMYLFLSGGEIEEEDLDPHNDRFDKDLLEQAFALDVVSITPTFELLYNKERKEEFVKKSLDCLLGWLVKKKPTQNQGFCYKFTHDSIEETLALLYGEKTPIGYIQNCPRKFLRFVTVAYPTSPGRIRISSDEQYNVLFKRLIREFLSDFSVSQGDWSDDKYRQITSLDIWADTWFLQAFIRWLSDQNVDKNLCHQIKLALLNEACGSGAEECVLYLLSEGVKPDERTPFYVVKRGSLNVLYKLLEYDIVPNARARRSQSLHSVYNINVLHEACLFEREDMVTMLCDTCPNLVHNTVGQSTLHLVALTGNCFIFQTVERALLKSLPREQYTCESVDGRLVHRSCVCAQYMSELLENFGETVLHVSCFWGHKDLSVYLCQSYPALVTCVDELGRSVLHLSCRWGHGDLCVYLCQSYPALTKLVDKDGRHCLHLIARFMSDVNVFIECETQVKQYLESTGHEYDITTILDKKGRSILDNAKERVQYRVTKSNPLCDHLVQLFSR